MQARFHLQGAVNSTGGSTGEPTCFFHDTPMLRAQTAAKFYTHTRLGWKPGMATVIIWGSERDIGRSQHWKTRIGNRILRRFLVDGYNLNQQTVDQVVRLVLRHRPVALYGFTSMLEFVARAVLEGPPLPKESVGTAWCGGEMLFPEQGAVFKRAFGVPILNYYGGRELGAMAFQTEAEGPLQILRPWLFAEIVDDQNRPVGPGETGKLLWTSTVCQGTPFLRYDVGDLAVFDAAGQNESGIVALSKLQGRVASVLELPNGKRINNIFWNHLFKEFPEVHQFQVILKSDGSLEIRLRGQRFVPSRETECSTVLHNFLGEVPFRITWVDRIPLTAQGKLLQVVRESPALPLKN
jgi:phenylacetate-CoA ligase